MRVDMGVQFSAERGAQKGSKPTEVLPKAQDETAERLSDQRADCQRTCHPTECRFCRARSVFCLLAIRNDHSSLKTQRKTTLRSYRKREAFASRHTEATPGKVR